MTPKLKQNEIAKALGYSTSSLQRYRNDINMPSRYRIPPNITNKRRQKISNTNLNYNSHRERDVRRRQRPQKPQLISKFSSPETVNPKKNKMKGGVKNEINDKNLDEILHINNQ